jgi:hypothetical protein
MRRASYTGSATEHEALELSPETIAEVRSRERRRDSSYVPGSRHFASVLAYGDFVFEDGPSLRCEAIPGISGVVTEDRVEQLKSGQPQVRLRRVLTHFHFDDPPVLIEQHYKKASTGILTGVAKGAAAALLPAKASFSQYLILMVDGRVLANREPLVMTAERVEEWPPIGSSFISAQPTEFFEIDAVDQPNAKVVAVLMACNAITVDEFSLPAEQLVETRERAGRAAPRRSSR